MTNDEFMYHLSKLGSAFGKTEKQIDALSDIYFAQISDRFDSDQMKKTTDFILTNSERFPTIRDILLIGKMFPTPKIHIYTTCCVCWGDGIIRTRKNGYRSIWKCPSCQNCTYNYPVWSDDFIDFMHNGYEKEYPPGWEGDEAQLKGLALLGPNSIAWKKAPEEMQEKARELLKTGWIPIDHKIPDLDDEERISIQCENNC